MVKVQKGVYSEAMLEKFRKMRTCPLYWVEVMFKLEPQKVGEPFVNGKHVTWQQVQILKAVEIGMLGGKRRITVRSGHGIGKSCVMAWVLLWFLFCWPNAQVPCTAPTTEQMYDVLWKEAAKWIAKLPANIKRFYEWQSTHIRIVENPQIWFARAKTGRKESPEALAGVHSDHVCMLIDEASGIPDEVFSTAEGSLTNKNILVLMISNPTRLIGYFHDSFYKDSDAWEKLNFSSIDSPIVEAGYIDRMVEKYGKESDEYRVRVLGEFPQADSVDRSGYVQLIQQEDIKKVASNTPLLGALRLGVDPAGEGRNSTVWVLRGLNGARILGKEDISTPRSIAAKTLTLMTEYNLKGGQVYVDNFGIGANVAQELGLAGVRVQSVNSGAKPDDERFLNKRAEIAWRAREWLKTGGTLVESKEWDELLLIRYKANLSGKIQVMSKDEMRHCGIKSPDCFIAGTLIKTPKGDIKIEDLKNGEYVLTPFGKQKIIKKWDIKTNKLCKVYFNNGEVLIGKPKHKIYTRRGFIRLDSLLKTDKIEVYSIFNKLLWKLKSLLFIKAKSIGFLKQSTIIMQTRGLKGKDIKSHYTEKCGKTSIIKKFLKDILFIIKMKIDLIIQKRIWELCYQGNTPHIIQENGYQDIKSRTDLILIKPLNQLRHGTSQMKAGSGTVNTVKKCGLIGDPIKLNVYNVRNCFYPHSRILNIVRVNVIKIIFIIQGGIKQIKEFANIVKRSFWLLGVGHQGIAVTDVQLYSVNPISVYNLTLENDNAYYANGILVNNCYDALALTFWDDEKVVYEKHYDEVVDDLTDTGSFNAYSVL